jgi:hypothetical protein
LANTAEELQFAALLEGYILRDPADSEQFHVLSRPILRFWARQHGWGLPDDAVEEVVQEVYAALLNPAGVSFDRTRGTARQYLLGRLLNAVKTVQAIYGVPRTGSDRERVFLSLEECSATFSCGAEFIDLITAREVIGKVFSEIEPAMKVVCLRVWSDGEAQAVVAKAVGISRFALARKLAKAKRGAAPFAACA